MFPIFIFTKIYSHGKIIQVDIPTFSFKFIHGFYNKLSDGKKNP